MGRDPEGPELRFEEVHAPVLDTREVVLGPPRPPRSKWWWLALPLVGALVGVAVTNSDSGRSSAPTTTTSPTTAAPPSTRQVTAPLVVPATATATVRGPALPYGRSTGMSLVFARFGPGVADLAAYDIDTGAVHGVAAPRLALDAPPALIVTSSAVFVGDSSSVVRLGDGPDVPILHGCYGRCTGDPLIASGPNGGVWFFDKTQPGRLVLLDAQGNRTDTGYAVPASALLFGSMADGRPVVQASDGLSYVVGPDGTFARLGGGVTTYVRDGRYIETVCGAGLRCALMAHTGRAGQAVDGVPVGPLGAAERDLSVAIDPSGRYVVVSGVSGVTLFDTVASTSVTLNTAPGGWGGLATPPAAFLPDGLGVVALSASGSIELYDLSGRMHKNVPLGDENGGNQFVGLVSTALLPAA